jgi:hypothetical protein
MPGMGKHDRRVNWRAIGRTAGTVTVAAILGLLTLGLLAAAGVSSYDNLFHLAASRGVPIPHLSPLEIDVGLIVVIAMDIVLTWLGHPIGGLRLLARILGIGTIAANVAAGWPDPVGSSMRAFAPVIIVAVTEAFRAFLLRRHRDADEQGIPFSRWMLAPWPTFVLWRRMKLWDIPGYRAAVDMELSRRQAIVKLEMHFGGKWKTDAPADLVWMLRAGVRMPEALSRTAVLVQADAEEDSLRAALEAERTARQQAEADCDTARAEAGKAVAKAEALARKLAATSKPEAGRGSGRKRDAVTTGNGTGNDTRKPLPVTAPGGPEEEAPEDLDSEARVLWFLDKGYSASQAGIKAGLSDGRGRQIARLAREAPKGIDQEGSS